MNKLLHHKKLIVILVCLLLVVSGSFIYQKSRIVKMSIETINQVETGYSKGCEGVSLYMCLKYKGYMDDISLDDFMSTIPRDDDNPYLGFVGDLNEKTEGKRQTIYPSPLASWGKKYGNVEDITGSTVAELKNYINKKQPVVVYVTKDFSEPEWKTYDYGRVVTNGHVIVLVGYNKKTGNYLVNDCWNGEGEYWVDKDIFENIYNVRKYAVVVK